MDIPLSSLDAVLALPLTLSMLPHVSPFVLPYAMLLIGHRYGVKWSIQTGYLTAIVCAAAFH